MGVRKLTDAEVVNIRIRHFLGGESRKDLAEKYNVAVSNIHQLCTGRIHPNSGGPISDVKTGNVIDSLTGKTIKTAGETGHRFGKGACKGRRRCSATPPSQPRLSNNNNKDGGRMEEEVIKSYMGEMKATDIAECLEVPSWKIYTILKKNGVLPLQVSLSKDEVLECVSMVQKGVAKSQVAEKFNVSPQTVTRALKQYEQGRLGETSPVAYLNFFKKKQDTKKTKTKPKRRKRAGRDGLVSTKTFARMLGVSSSTVYRLAAERGMAGAFQADNKPGSTWLINKIKALRWLKKEGWSLPERLDVQIREQKQEEEPKKISENESGVFTKPTLLSGDIPNSNMVCLDALSTNAIKHLRVWGGHLPLETVQRHAEAVCGFGNFCVRYHEDGKLVDRFFFRVDGEGVTLLSEPPRGVNIPYEEVEIKEEKEMESNNYNYPDAPLMCKACPSSSFSIREFAPKLDGKFKFRVQCEKCGAEYWLEWSMDKVSDGTLTLSLEEPKKG